MSSNFDKLKKLKPNNNITYKLIVLLALNWACGSENKTKYKLKKLKL